MVCMVGVFVQVNSESHKAKSHPIGYIQRESGCWEWQGAKGPLGYGRWMPKGGKMSLAHRVMYERHKGPIPAGLSLDHLCRNPSCVNPDHLEAVTHRENCLRGIAPVAVNAVKTHCANGHPFDAFNTYIRPDTGTRQCKACGPIRKRRKRCPSGHEYTLETSRYRPRSGPICLICHPNFPRLRGRNG